MLFDLAPVEEALKRGDTLLTPNRRLASAVREAWGLAQQQAGQGAWRAPAVHALEDWLRVQWDALVLSGNPKACAKRILSDTEERWVWERIIANSRHGYLLRAKEAARQGAKAWHTFLHWQCGEAEKQSFRGIEDCEAFLAWSAVFVRECDKKGWLNVAGRDLALHAAFRDGHLSPVPRLVLLNFKEQTPTPLQRSLLENAAAQLQSVQPVSRTANACRLACEDADAELYAAARWAHALLTGDAAATAGVVVPNLTARRLRVERIFLEVFAPGALLPGPSEGGSPFNISAGEPLARAAVPAAMLRLFGLFSRGLSPSEFRDLLCCPFLHFCEEPARSRLCEWLLEWPDITLSNAYLLRRLDGAKASTFNNLSATINNMPKKRASARQWCSFWRKQMDLWGCTGAGLSSLEYRGWTRWQRLLDEFADGSEVFGPLAAQEALDQLMRLAESTMSQPMGEGSRLHILEQLEVTGLSFSGLWLSGMGDRNWPPAAEPSPLLPIALQRERSMPRADAARELAYARELTQGYLGSARQVVCSYPMRDGDQVLGRPSTLVAKLPEADIAGLGAAAGEGELAAWRHRLRVSVSIETAAAGGAIPPPGEDALRGDTSLLKNQSACPFRGCAHHRWQIRDPQQAGFGLSSLEQGSLAHKALQILWGSLGGDSTALEDEERCGKAVAAAAAGAVEKMKTKLRGRPVLPGLRFWKAEKIRLERLLYLWLGKEMALAQERHFTVVTEQKEAFELEGLRLSLRPDRVDKLPEGRGYRIVDYKTGKRKNLLVKVRQGDWSGEFPREPQLLLYALAQASQQGSSAVKGIAYAALNSEDMGYVWGEDKFWEGESGEYPPPAADNWASQLAAWQASLENLAREYKEGRSEVRPRVQDACKYCEYGPLCRIRPEQRR